MRLVENIVTQYINCLNFKTLLVPLLKSIVNFRNPDRRHFQWVVSVPITEWRQRFDNFFLRQIQLLNSFSLSRYVFKKIALHTLHDHHFHHLPAIVRVTVKRKLWLNRQRPRWRCKVGSDGKPHPRCFRRTFCGERWFLGRTSCRPGSTVGLNNHENLKKKQLLRRVNCWLIF